MGGKWVRAAVMSAGVALWAVQPVAAKPSPIACDQWKDRLKAEAAKTRLLPPIEFELTKKITFEISGIDDIDLIADCKDGFIANLNGTVRGRSEITAVRWSALSKALAKSFAPSLNAAQIEKRIKAMSLTAKREFIEARVRGEKYARGSGLEEFGGYEMTIDIQDGWIGLSATQIEGDD